MKSFKYWITAGLLAVGLWSQLGSAPAMAQQSTAGCSVDYQDSSCLGTVSAAPQVAPTCPTTPGYTTQTAAVWQGSKFSAPACKFTPQPLCSAAPGWTTAVASTWNGASWSVPVCSFAAAPVCPPGFNQTNPPSWNGSSWVGLSCQPIAPVCPAGFTCDGSGTPYALLIGYCGEDSQTTILHIVHYTFKCTSSMAGMSRVNQSGTLFNGNGTLDYWNTPGSFTETIVSASSSGAFENAPGPAGTVVQTVDILFGSIIWGPGDSSTAAQFLEGSAGGGSNEGWVFACPAAHPTVNFGTVSAFGESNPTLIQCQ